MLKQKKKKKKRKRILDTFLTKQVERRVEHCVFAAFLYVKS